MAHDHIADLFVLKIQAVGKHLLCDQISRFLCARLHKEFLIKCRIALVHFALGKLLLRKILHALHIALVCGRLLLLIGCNAGIDKGTFGISQGIAIVGEIHQKSLGELDSSGGIHGLHIVFIKSGQAQPMLHCQGKPAEIFRLSGISLHHIFADGFQGIVRRILVVSPGHCLVNALIIVFLISGKICKTHDKLLREKIPPCCKTEHLSPEAAQTMKQSHVLTDNLPRFQIKEWASASLVKLLFQHEQGLGRSLLVSRIQLQKDPQKEEAVAFLHVEIADSGKGMYLVLVQSGKCAQIQINPCKLQIVPCIGFVPVALKKCAGFLMVVLQIKKKDLVHLIFRIFTAGLVQLVQNIMATCTPGGKVHPAICPWIVFSFQIACLSGFIAKIRQAVPQKIQLALLLIQADIHVKLAAGRGNNGVNQLLIRALYHNFAKLVSRSKLLLMKQVFYLIVTADEILICHNLPWNIQEIPCSFHIKAQMSPSASLYIEGFLH